VTNGIKGTAMQLLQAAKEFQVWVNTSAEAQQHWEVHMAGLVANSTGSDKAINFLVEAGALGPMVGKGTM
jgi:hypothetical protein